jgi:hypothetical protein
VNKVKVEIKGIKYFEGPDGYAFSANVYVNGKRTASIMDEGYGGGLRIDVADQDRYAMIEKAIENLTWDSPWSDEAFPYDMEFFLGELAEDAIAKKDAKGKLITQSDDDAFHTWNVKFSSAKPDEHEARLVKAGYAGHKVVNHILGTRVLEIEG